MNAFLGIWPARWILEAPADDRFRVVSFETQLPDALIDIVLERIGCWIVGFQAAGAAAVGAVG